MENNRINESTIEKYYNCLLELRNLLTYTKKISMNTFCQKNKVSKSFAQVLAKGGVIKCTTRGKYSEWEWTTIEPNKQMAAKALKMLNEYHTQRNPRVKKGLKEEIKNKLDSKNNTTNPNLNYVISKDNTKKTIVFTLFWGLFSFTINI